MLRRDGRLSVLLVNKNPDTARTVDLDYAGFTPSAAAPEVRRYAREDSDITAVTGGQVSASRATVPPYALLTVTLEPQPGTGPGASAAGTPGTPRLEAVTDTTARLSWESASGATRYLVQERDGAHTRLVGETTTGTSVTLRNLPPGSSHTVNVLAADASGRLSAPSSPLTFTTGTPPEAPCAVSYHRDTSWGNGFVATVTVRNLSSTAITGWTVDWDWPADGQSVSSGWNAAFHQTGRHVRVTAPEGAGPLAPDGGSTASFDSSAPTTAPNPEPTVFRLNGTVCSGRLTTGPAVHSPSRADGLPPQRLTTGPAVHSPSGGRDAGARLGAGPRSAPTAGQHHTAHLAFRPAGQRRRPRLGVGGRAGWRPTPVGAGGSERCPTAPRAHPRLGIEQLTSGARSAGQVMRSKRAVFLRGSRWTMGTALLCGLPYWSRQIQAAGALHAVGAVQAQPVVGDFGEGGHRHLAHGVVADALHCGADRVIGDDDPAVDEVGRGGADLRQQAGQLP